MAPTGRNGNGRRLSTPQSVDQAVKSICDIMRRGNCAGAMQYVPELTWILFLRILDEKEQREESEAEALGVAFRPSLDAPYRWRDWGAPPEALAKGQTNKRVELQNAPQNAFFSFVNTDLLPHLKALKTRPDASPRQKVISEIRKARKRRRASTTRPGPRKGSSGSTSSAACATAGAAASCWMRGCSSAPTRMPLSRPSASSSTTATCGAW